MAIPLDGSQINGGIAFVAGLVSFMSGCHLPLLPVYFSYFLGVASIEEERPNRWRLAVHGLFFVFGFLGVFLMIGLAGSSLSIWLAQHRLEIGRLFGLVFLFFGLRLLHVINIQLGISEKVQKVGENAAKSTVASSWSSWLVAALFGAAMALLWIPCIGPVLAVVFYLSSTPESHSAGVFYMVLYGLGLMSPVLLLAALSDVGRRRFPQKIPPRIMDAVRVITGFVLTVLGIFILTGHFSWLDWIVTVTK
jgi:cytochrome c-type biogenesis protein